ncbi:MAG: pentapeptide repeat-containing protein [Thiohalomonadaceae bacterium]
MIDTHNWFVRRNKEVKGPFPARLIGSYILLGRISEQDEASQDRQEWLPISAIPELIPKVIHAARAHPDDAEAQERLAAARRWADERAVAKGPPSNGDRREGEEDVLVVFHEIDGIHPGRAIKPRDYFLVIGALLALILIAFLIPSTDKPDEPECDAPPAPGVNWSNCRMEGGQYPNANLAGANLRSANLIGAVLRAANLVNSDLSYANLSLANLRGANLHGASLKGANLRNTDLTNANLESTDLSYADLSAVDLQAVNLAGARLDHAIWRGGASCLPGSVGECLLR